MNGSTTSFSIEQIPELGRRARRLILSQSLLWWLASALAFLLVCVAFDFGLGGDNGGIRQILSLCWLGFVLGSGWIIARRAVATSIDDLTVAQFIERRYPIFEDRLSSVVNFRTSPKSQLIGDERLRQQVESEAIALCRQVDVDELLETQGFWKAISVALGMCLVSLFFVALEPGVAWAGLVRMAIPWQTTRWPTENYLAFDSLPPEVLLGSDLIVRVVDRNENTPNDVVLYVSSLEDENGPLTSRREMKRNGDFQEAVLANITSPIRLRAEGGDDRQMTWHEVRIIDAPQVEELTIEVIPPSYARKSPSKLRGHFEALEGSRIRVNATSSRSLQAASLCVVDEERKLHVFPLVVHEDRLRFMSKDPMPWHVAGFGQYYFRLVDESDVIGSQPRWNFSARKDQPPAFLLEDPHEDRVACRNSTLPIVGRVDDDLGIAEVRLHAVTSQGVESTIKVVEAAGNELPITFPIEFEWRLATIEQLTPNTALSYYLSAVDSAGHVNESSVYTVHILTDDALFARFVDMEREIRRQLRDVFQMQENAMLIVSQADRSERPWSHTASFNQIVQVQERIRDGIVGAEGAIGKLDALSQRLSQSGLQCFGFQYQIASVQSKLEYLDESTLIPIRDMLTRREIDSRGMPSINAHQQAVRDTLKAILGETSDVAKAVDVIGQLEQILAEQESIHESTVRLFPRTVAKELDDMRDTERTEVFKLEARQRKLTDDMGILVDQVHEWSPVEERNGFDLAATSARVEEYGLVARCLDVADDIQLNRIGRAIESQQRLLVDLHRLGMHLRGDLREIAFDARAPVPILAWIEEQTSLLVMTRDATVRDDLAEIEDRQLALAAALAKRLDVGVESVPSWAIDRSRERMLKAAECLRAADRPAATRHQQLVLECLQLLQQSSLADSEMPTGQGEYGRKNENTVGELRLLRALQHDLNQRTQSTSVAAERQILAAEQGELAELFRRIMVEQSKANFK